MPARSTVYVRCVLNETDPRERESDSARPEFWSQRYASGRTPWQLDGIPDHAAAFLARTAPRSKVLIPGCGSDHQVIRAFREAGHDVTAIDFSAVAVEQAKNALGKLRDTVILGDFFSYAFGAIAFDIVYERTFLCSLPPRLWDDYAGRVAQLLRPKGMLVGCFLYGEESDPPPYPLKEDKAAELFCSRFKLVRSEPVSDPLPIFAGMEKWQEWRRY